jgi:hypothetical protein
MKSATYGWIVWGTRLAKVSWRRQDAGTRSQEDTVKKQTGGEEWIDMGLGIAALCASLAVAVMFLLSSSHAIDETASAWRTQAVHVVSDR